MNPEIVRSRVAKARLDDVAADGFGDMVKVVVDVRRGVLALGGSLHADGEALLLDDGSAQDHLWGANVYLGKPREQQIEYTSLINIRPAGTPPWREAAAGGPRQGNKTMTIEAPEIREAVATVIRQLLPLP